MTYVLRRKKILSQRLNLVLFICIFQGALEYNESKVLYFQLELLETKEELQRKVSEKDEEIEKFRYLRLF